jgi:hypothetical protein
VINNQKEGIIGRVPDDALSESNFFVFLNTLRMMHYCATSRNILGGRGGLYAFMYRGASKKFSNLTSLQAQAFAKKG